MLDSIAAAAVERVVLERVEELSPARRKGRAIDVRGQQKIGLAGELDEVRPKVPGQHHAAVEGVCRVGRLVGRDVVGVPPHADLEVAGKAPTLKVNRW